LSKNKYWPVVNEIIFLTLAGLGLRKKNAEGARNLSNLYHNVMAKKWIGPHKMIERAKVKYERIRRRDQQHLGERSLTMHLFWSARKTN
jgi:hypothetical protein